MAQSSLLAPGQFAKKRQKRKDPHADTSTPKFSGNPGESKTMTISGGGGLPKPQDKHMHHRKAGRRSHRIG